MPFDQQKQHPIGQNQQWKSGTQLEEEEIAQFAAAETAMTGPEPALLCSVGGDSRAFRTAKILLINLLLLVYYSIL
jgi:hypothetical protein